jgi:hypothetical protein
VPAHPRKACFRACHGEPTRWRRAGPLGEQVSSSLGSDCETDDPAPWLPLLLKQPRTRGIRVFEETRGCGQRPGGPICARTNRNPPSPRIWNGRKISPAPDGPRSERTPAGGEPSAFAGTVAPPRNPQSRSVLVLSPACHPYSLLG